MPIKFIPIIQYQLTVTLHTLINGFSRRNISQRTQSI